MRLEEMNTEKPVSTKWHSNTNDTAIIDTNYIVLRFNTESVYFNHWYKAKLNSIKPVNISKNEIIEIDKIAQAYIYQNKINLLDWSAYKRQYIPVINDKGEKEVWVNCLCQTIDSDWKKRAIIVMDGGNCFFNFTISLTTKNITDFSINGLG